MKKIIVGIIFPLLLLSGSIYFRDPSTTISSSGIPIQPNDSPSSTASTIAKPQTLEIPSINVHASVEFVGIDAKKNMDVPKDPDNVGWYELGYTPGEQGNAVIAGHLDTKTSPAVFAKLSQVKPGDEVLVHTQSGSTQRFIVEKIKQYPYDKFPLQEVFGDSEEKRLNLITCTGTFDFGKENYSHRTVVYTILKD